MIPEQDSENYRSYIGHLDGRLDLYKTLSFPNYLPQMRTLNASNDVNFMDLIMLAAEVAYENEAYIKKAVNHWKVGFGSSKGMISQSKLTDLTLILYEKLSQYVLAGLRWTWSKPS